MSGFWKFLVAYRKPLLIGLAVFGLVAGVAAAWKAFRTQQQKRVVAELALSTQLTVDSALQARLTVNTLARDSLAQALKAEKKLSGELRAALRIDIPARETLIVERPVPTDTLDGIRIAHFRDSTFAGIISGTVTAPKYPAPLSVGYQVFRPAFSPTVAFVAIGDTVAAVVHWQGEEARITTPYWRSPNRVKFLQGFVEINYTTDGWASRLGPLANLTNNGKRILGMDMQLQGWIGTGNGFSAGTGLRGVF